MPPKPGLLLVHPLLHNPTPANAATFLRWTKLHFRDLLNLPSVVAACRFTAPESSDDKEKYTHVAGKGLPAYLYTCVVDDVGVLLEERYRDVSRELNLEGTRALGEGEEAVGVNEEGEGEGKKMVWDVVDARFAVFEEVENPDLPHIPPYQTSLPHLTTPTGSAPPSCLIRLSITSPNPPTALHASLLACFSIAPPCLKLYTSLYRWSGVEAQPEQHALIEGREWMVLLLIVDEQGGMLQREHSVQLVEGWAKEVGGEGVQVEGGVWNGEVFMG